MLPVIMLARATDSHTLWELKAAIASVDINAAKKITVEQVSSFLNMFFCRYAAILTEKMLKIGSATADKIERELPIKNVSAMYEGIHVVTLSLTIPWEITPIIIKTRPEDTKSCFGEMYALELFSGTASSL